MTGKALETPSVKGPAAAQAKARKKRSRRQRSHGSLLAAREPSIWVTGGALIVCVVMIVSLLLGVLYTGLSTFWPREIVRLETVEGEVYMGAVTRQETYLPDEEVFEQLSERRVAQGGEPLGERRRLGRSLVRTGNYRLTQSHFEWVEDALVKERTRPEWAMLVERMEWGCFYGFPDAFVLVDLLETSGPDGLRKSPESLLEEADSALASFEPKHGGEPRLIVERFEGGDGRLVPIRREELESPGTIRGIAEVVEGPEAAMLVYDELHGQVRSAWEERRGLEKFDTGEVNHALEESRLAMRRAELELEDAQAEQGADSEVLEAALAAYEARSKAYEEKQAWGEREFDRIRGEIDAINQANARYQLLFHTAGEGHAPPVTLMMGLDQIVRAVPANRMGLGAKLATYLSRWWEFVSGEPREANSEGGVYPAIFGTVLMTLIMAVLVVPFGVLAALYLREYAKEGPLVSAVRIAVNNLAGVPSIVFGVFGLGFFCYAIGSGVDDAFFRAELPNPTFGKGGLIWASLTLALLTLPVVIVATEEALSAVPNSAREGSYACGAGKWQTIKRIVLPRAMPGIMTGMILAMARGAGEVAPLMLVGAVKLAPDLPIDGTFPYIHAQRSFMHLGFHIFDVGFQSQNSEAAKPMVYTTTLVLIALIFTLNLVAIGLRKRLARRFESAQI